jgi:hypothetical protein
LCFKHKNPWKNKFRTISITKLGDGKFAIDKDQKGIQGRTKRWPSKVN